MQAATKRTFTIRPLVATNLAQSAGELIDILMISLIAINLQMTVSLQYRVTFILGAVLSSASGITMARCINARAGNDALEYESEIERLRLIVKIIFPVIALTEAGFFVFAFGDLPESTKTESAIYFLLSGVAFALIALAQPNYIRLISERKNDELMQINLKAAFINILVSIVGGFALGIIGLAIGTLISKTYLCIRYRKFRPKVAHKPTVANWRPYLGDVSTVLLTSLIAAIAAALIVVEIAHDPNLSRYYGFVVALLGVTQAVGLAIGTDVAHVVAHALRATHAKERQQSLYAVRKLARNYSIASAAFVGFGTIVYLCATRMTEGIALVIATSATWAYFNCTTTILTKGAMRQIGAFQATLTITTCAVLLRLMLTVAGRNIGGDGFRDIVFLVAALLSATVALIIAKITRNKIVGNIHLCAGP